MNIKTYIYIYIHIYIYTYMYILQKRTGKFISSYDIFLNIDSRFSTRTVSTVNSTYGTPRTPREDTSIMYDNLINDDYEIKRSNAIDVRLNMSKLNQGKYIYLCICVYLNLCFYKYIHIYIHIFM
jgi:hypothetical protein